MAVTPKMDTEQSVEPKQPVRTEKLTGERAIIWNPDLDPTCEKLPSIATPIRPFVLTYLNSVKTALTSVNPNGGMVPQMGTFILRQPGVNWVKCEDWDRAVEAGEHYGKSPEAIESGMPALARLNRTMQHGEDPLAVQFKAGAIVLPELLLTGYLSGTIGDYTFEGVRAIVEATPEIQQLRYWLIAIQTAIEPHPDKRKIAQFIERTISTREGVR